MLWSRGETGDMPPARPGLTDIGPYSRYDQTTPDLYASARAGSRTLAPPRPLAQDEDRRLRESPGRSSARRRRQWGGDRRDARAMPMVPKPVSDTRVAMGRLAIIVTVCAWLAYTVLWFFSDFFHPGYEGAVARTEEVLYLVI